MKIKDQVAALKDGELVAVLARVKRKRWMLRRLARAELDRRRVWGSRWGVRR